MACDKQYDLIIAGAGLVGASLAAHLADLPLSIALVDAQPVDSNEGGQAPRIALDDFDARVSALTPRSVKFLQQAGAWQNIASYAQPYRAMRVWDALGTEHIEFDAQSLACSELGYIVENKLVLQALLRQIRCLSNVDLISGHKITSVTPLKREGMDSGQFIVLDDGRELRCSLLAAADGANSSVRSLLSIPTREWDYDHRAIVCTLQTEKAHELTARQRFSESGPVALLPLMDSNGSGRFCSLVWSASLERADELMAMDDAAFCAALGLETEHVLGGVIAVSKRFSFPLRQRHAKDYIKGSVVLLGDAAHVIHPLAGQGVNLGFKDVEALSGLLHKAQDRSIAINDPVLLRRYQRERQGENLMMMGLMEGFKRIFEQSNPLVRLARNVGLAWVDRQSLVKKQIVRRAMGL